MKIEVVRDKHPFMAVLVDEEAKKAEVIEVKYLNIASILIDQIGETLHIGLVWGGYDSKGEWHIDYRIEAATASISGKRPEEAKLFEKMCRLNKSYNCCYDEAFFKALLGPEGVIATLNERVWGFSDFAVIINDEEVFRKGKPKKPKEG